MMNPREARVALSDPPGESAAPWPFDLSARGAEPTYTCVKAAPFVKWVGGKRSLIKDLMARFPQRFGTYWEPFAGGGALFFGIHERINGAVLSDFNLDLVITYNVIKMEHEALIDKLETHAEFHGKEYYYSVRHQHDLQDSIDVAARFIYLNKTCYNGLYRVNKKGEFNVPIGSYDNPEIVNRANIKACHRALQRAVIQFQEFEAIEPLPGDLVYCDPPYHPVSSTSFTKYTKYDFGEEAQIRLRDFLLGLHNNGVNVILSNSDTPLIRDLYEPTVWNSDVVKAPRNVNSKASGRGRVDELIIRNYL